MKIIKDETSFMRDNVPALDVDVTAVVSPTYKKALEDREKIRARIKKQLKDKEARKEPVLGTKADKLTLGESLFEDIEESKKLNEGAGAGYTIEGKLSDIFVNSVYNIRKDKNGFTLCDCEGTAVLTDIEARSYMYGNDVGGKYDVAITTVTVDADELGNKYTDEDSLKDFINDEALNSTVRIKGTVGGGWSHEEFKGEFNARVSDSSNYTDFDGFTIRIDNDIVIKAIDDAVTGNDWVEEYAVYDEDDDVLEYFETKEEAVDFAKKNRGVRVTKRNVQYTLLSDGESVDATYDGTEEDVWEREYTRSYKYDESLTEKKCHKELKKKLEESYGVDVIEDLVDRVESNYDGDLEEAVRKAIDDGLIYTEDIFALMEYIGGASDVSDLFFKKYYEALFDELYKTSKERLGVDECIKEDVEEVTDETTDEVEVEKEKKKRHRTSSHDLWDFVYNEIFFGETGADKKAIPVVAGHDLINYQKGFFDPKKKGIYHGNGEAIGARELITKDKRTGKEKILGIDRLFDVADALGLKTRRSNSGKSAYVILPDEYWDSPYTKFMDDKGLNYRMG